MIEKIAGLGDIVGRRSQRLGRRPNGRHVGRGEHKTIFLAERRQHRADELRLLLSLFRIHRSRRVAQQHDVRAACRRPALRAASSLPAPAASVARANSRRRRGDAARRHDDPIAGRRFRNRLRNRASGEYSCAANSTVAECSVCCVPAECVGQVTLFSGIAELTVTLDRQLAQRPQPQQFAPQAIGVAILFARSGSTCV